MIESSFFDTLILETKRDDTMKQLSIAFEQLTVKKNQSEMIAGDLAME